MRYVVDKEHRDFFQKEGKIEFEGIFTLEQLAVVNKAIDQALAARCLVTEDKLLKCSSEQLFTAGRDLWRDQEELRKFITHGRLTETVVELVEQRPLRIAYDQLLPACPPRIFDNVYTRYLSHPGSLNDVSCIEGIVCGVMILLNNTVLNDQVTSVTDFTDAPGVLDVFPSKSGNAVFFQSSKPIDWERLLKHTGQRFLLVSYAEMNAFYKLQERDPHTQALKRLDYRFGERLSDRFHLVVAR